MTARITPLRADEVLHELVAASDIFDIGGRKFMVTILSDQRIEDMVVLMARSENDEPDTDMEPSLGYTPSTGIYGGAAVVDAEGPDTDSEPDLGWQNTGPQLRLHTGDEGDGDCDAEPSLAGKTVSPVFAGDDGEYDGDEGDYSLHQLTSVDHDIRLMLRDNIIRKRSRRTGGGQ